MGLFNKFKKSINEIGDLTIDAGANDPREVSRG